jgi:predicted glycoside hydrolase/deacetylase ChbG (UPF0249 family)
MMNFPNSADDIALALAETPELGLGVHLCLTSGYPVSPPEEVPGLITAENKFHGLLDFIDKLDDLDIAQVKKEWTAQIEKFVSLTDRNPTHLDSHHHSSFYTAPLFRAMLELAREYDCAIRQVNVQVTERVVGVSDEMGQDIKSFAPALIAEFNTAKPDVFFASFYDDYATKKVLLDALQNAKDGELLEIMCHPGYSDAALEASSVYNRQRETELAILTDAAVQAAVDDLGLELVTFNALK